MPTKRPRSSQFNFRGEGKKRVTQPRGDHASFSRGTRSSRFAQTSENVNAHLHHEQPILRSSARINEIRSRNTAGENNPAQKQTAQQNPKVQTSAPNMRRGQVSSRGSVLSTQRNPKKPSIVQRGNVSNNTSSMNASKADDRPLKRTKITRDSAPRQRSITTAIAEQNMSGHIWNQSNQAPRKKSRSKGSNQGSISAGNSPFSRTRSSAGSNFKGQKGSPALHSVKAKRRFPIRIVACVLAVLLVLGVANGIDSLINGDKIYQGVSIGEVDVSGLTREEAIEAVTGYYSPRVSGNVATF